jgi:hypothetical protein
MNPSSFSSRRWGGGMGVGCGGFGWTGEQLMERSSESQVQDVPRAEVRGHVAGADRGVVDGRTRGRGGVGRGGVGRGGGEDGAVVEVDQAVAEHGGVNDGGPPVVVHHVEVPLVEEERPHVSTIARTN